MNVFDHVIQNEFQSSQENDFIPPVPGNEIPGDLVTCPNCNCDSYIQVFKVYNTSNINGVILPEPIFAMSPSFQCKNCGKELTQDQSPSDSSIVQF